MNIKKTIARLFLPLLLGAALVLPASAQTQVRGNNFDLGDITGIGNNGGYGNGGMNTGAILGIANILYQITQQNRNNDYPAQYPNAYPYPNQYPNGYPNGYPPAQYPNTYPNGYPSYPTQYPNSYPNGYPTYPYSY